MYVINVEAVIVQDDRFLIIKRGENEDYMAGVLCLVGGKVEAEDNADRVLEDTIRREIREEVGVEVADTLTYVKSSLFTVDDTAVVDVVFLCPYKSGKPSINDPGEVAGIHWMTASEILNNPQIPPWTQSSIKMARDILNKQQD